MVGVQAYGERTVDEMLSQIKKGKAHDLGDLTEVKVRTQHIVRNCMEHGFYAQKFEAGDVKFQGIAKINDENMFHSVLIDEEWSTPHTSFWRWFVVFAAVEVDFGQDVVHRISQVSEDILKAATPEQRKVYVAVAIV